MMISCDVDHPTYVLYLMIWKSPDERLQEIDRNDEDVRSRHDDEVKDDKDDDDEG